MRESLIALFGQLRGIHLRKGRKKIIYENIEKYAKTHLVRNGKKKRLTGVMSDQPKELFGALRSIHLSPEHKEERYASILRRVQPERSRRERVSWVQALQLLHHTRMMLAGFIGIVVLFSVGGVAAYFVEDSLPGSALYNLKVEVAEEAISALYVFPKQRAQWEISRAENRLTDAAELALSGTIDADKLQDIVVHFKEHTETIEEIAKALDVVGKKDEAEEIQEGLEVSLRAHKQVLLAVLQRQASAESLLRTLFVAIDSEQDDAIGDRLRVEQELRQQIISLPSSVLDETLRTIEGKMEQQAKVIARGKKRMVEIPEWLLSAEERMLAAQNTLALAHQLEKEGHPQRAYTLAKVASRLIQESSVRMAAHHKMQADLTPETNETEETNNAGAAASAIMLARERANIMRPHLRQSMADLGEDQTEALRIRFGLAVQILDEADAQFAQQEFDEALLLGSESLQVLENVGILERAQRRHLESDKK